MEGEGGNKRRRREGGGGERDEKEAGWGREIKLRTVREVPRQEIVTWLSWKCAFCRIIIIIEMDLVMTGADVGNQSIGKPAMLELVRVDSSKPATMAPPPMMGGRGVGGTSQNNYSKPGLWWVWLSEGRDSSCSNLPKGLKRHCSNELYKGQC